MTHGYYYNTILAGSNVRESKETLINDFLTSCGLREFGQCKFLLRALGSTTDGLSLYITSSVEPDYNKQVRVGDYEVTNWLISSCRIDEVAGFEIKVNYIKDDNFIWFSKPHSCNACAYIVNIRDDISLAGMPCFRNTNTTNSYEVGIFLSEYVNNIVNLELSDITGQRWGIGPNECRVFGCYPILRPNNIPGKGFVATPFIMGPSIKDQSIFPCMTNESGVKYPVYNENLYLVSIGNGSVGSYGDGVNTRIKVNDKTLLLLDCYHVDSSNGVYLGVLY